MYTVNVDMPAESAACFENKLKQDGRLFMEMKDGRLIPIKAIPVFPEQPNEPIHTIHVQWE
jgi:hypothetical protein